MLYTLFSLRILGTMQAGQLSPLMAFDTSKVKTNKSKVCVQISYLNVCTKIFVYPKYYSSGGEFIVALIWSLYFLTLPMHSHGIAITFS